MPCPAPRPPTPPGSRKYWLETLGCPKNRVDSDKLEGTLQAAGYGPAPSPAGADLVVVNTCAFIEEARQESVDQILQLSRERKDGSRLVVTGCLAERYGEELAEALPEVDLVAGFGVPLTLGAKPHGTEPGRTSPDRTPLPKLDLLNLPRPRPQAPWAYVKVAEGCDRKCGFCAIPTFRGSQRSRHPDSVLAEVDSLGVEEVVLVAQDLLSYGRDIGRPGAITGLVEAVSSRVARTRLLYLYPSGLTDDLIDVVAGTGCPYFDLSLQHASRPLLRRMRRPGGADRFLERIERIRGVCPEATLRSSFVIGYPGETEADHDVLLGFLAEADLDWAGFFPFSPEEGTLAVGLPGRVSREVVAERIAECGELQDSITCRRRLDLVGSRLRLLVDEPGVARSHREAPEIDGVVRLPATIPSGTWVDAEVTGAEGPDLEAVA